MDKKYTVHITDDADIMLVEHATFLDQVSHIAADKLIEEFKEKAKSLEHMPERNPYLEGPFIPKKTYHKLLLFRRYQIIYSITNDMVIIRYVIDCRQDNSWLIF